jgi:hypothetical protein
VPAFFGEFENLLGKGGIRGMCLLEKTSGNPV